MSEPLRSDPVSPSLSSPIRFIAFDCMETLIQMDIPSKAIYPDWAWSAAAELGLWSDIDVFRHDWQHEIDQLLARDDGLREDTVSGRISSLLVRRLALAGDPWSTDRVERETERIFSTFWDIYRNASFVLPEVIETLSILRERKDLRMGVVSNFMVPGGVPELLKRHGIRDHFEQVVVSCDVGWRKPSPRIYEALMRASGCEPNEVLFVGDNPLADYEGPRRMGMRSVLYDRSDSMPRLEARLGSFHELLDCL